MVNTKSNGVSVTPTQYEQILRVAASQRPVKEALLRSHDNNTWWPKHVKDWGTRMLIAGLSARISYRMVPIYREIIDKLDSHSWDSLATMPEEEMVEIIGRIGLHKTRIRFWRSLASFIDLLAEKGMDFRAVSNDELISLIQTNVEGASYKLAQCCVLYAKGYHCGVIPVDSGMKDMLGPCLGFPIPPGAYGHEAFRIQLEKLTSAIDCRRIAFELGYGQLDLPEHGPLTWWAHIVLISYKRFFCNNRKPEHCALRNSPSIGIGVGSACSKQRPEYGGTRAIIIEGVDKTGKTSLAHLIRQRGYQLHHFRYNEQRTGAEIRALYRDLFETSRNRRIVLDRSFISEEVYGSVLRGESRLCRDDLRELLELLRELCTTIVYLHAPGSILRQRATQGSSKDDAELLESTVPPLINKYEEILDRVQNYVPIRRFDTSRNTTLEIAASLFQ
jgi:thymidylate kinase/endonuclease III